MSARTILKHVYENGGMTEYQYEKIDRVLKERERPHGEWVLDQEFSFVLNMYKCSKCRFNGSKRWHFCPNCGASMVKKEGEKNESDHL